MTAYPKYSHSTNHPILPDITKKRLALFQKGHYRDYNLTSSLDRERCSGEQYVQMTIWSAPGTEKPSFDEATQSLQGSDVRPYRVGDWLGPSWTNHWVKAKLNIPSTWRSSGEPVIFEFDPNCEALIFTLKGEPIHAITGGADSRKDGQPGMAEDRRVEFVIPQEAVQAGVFECYIEVSVNAMFGLGLNGFRHQQPDMNISFQLATADLVLPRMEARRLDIDFQMLTQIAKSEEGGSKDLQMKALNAANEIMNTFTRTQGDEEGAIDDVVKKCRGIASKILGEVLSEGGERSFAHLSDEDLKIWAIGHCHIDTAWLWCYKHTQQKIARSWSTQVDLIKRFPTFHFGASSAQQYAWLNDLYPSLFDAVKEQVIAGRFHPIGGAWLEHDCLIPSGESLCRQYLYGQRYFEEQFGVRCREAWLPDTFGYASQLPQILRLSGIDYFFTQKLSWNNINVFPHSTFNWIGLDGSQVLSHMTPVDSYNSQCNYDELIKGQDNNKTLGMSNQCLLLFGNGDGGGGPTPRMLEKLERLCSASAANSDMPSVAPRKPIEFFEQVRKSTDNGRKLPTWQGELYFELHRGIYTSQANIKKGNHELEHHLRDLEYIATLASIHSPSYQYPKAELDEMWKDLMLNQFHDVLPGTSIAMAIQDALDIYEQRINQAKALYEKTLAALGGGQAETIIFDPYRQPRTALMTVDEELTAIAIDSSGLGSKIDKKPMTTAQAAQKGDSYELSNGQLRLTISNGRITSLVDLTLDRELITPGPGMETGGLMIYEDLPLAYDAWDAEIYHLDCSTELFFSEVAVESSPLRSALIATAKFGKSTIKLTFSLDAKFEENALSCLRVDADVDWLEKHKFLKFALPVDIFSPTATYGTQYGLIERPTHRNTTQEQAKFEVFGHGCADLSEKGYGITMTSAYKYGYAVEGNTMRISLLRSSTAPDPRQDEGHHSFSFGIIPHKQRFLESGAWEESLRFINPVQLVQAGAQAKDILLTKAVHMAPGTSIVLDAVKRGEDDDKDGKRSIVLRMYESLGGRSKGQLHLRGIKPKSAVWVNVLEEPIEGEALVDFVEVDGGVAVKVNMNRFEIKTLRVEL